MGSPLVSVLLTLGVTAGVGLLAAPLVIRATRRIGWVDRPNFRKAHDGEVPLAGGVLIVASTAVVAAASGLWKVPAWQLWACAVIVFAIAFVDDRYPIRARWRFLVQLLAAFVVSTLSGMTVRDLGQSFGPFELSLGVLAMPFTIVAIATLTNAINMIDGLDGLAGGVAWGALFWLLIALLFIEVDLSAAGRPSAEAAQAAHAVAMLIGALFAFLLFNQRGPWRRRAAIFLGDGGSMTIGFLIASLTIYCSNAFGDASLSPGAAVTIVALPLMDLFSCMWRRLKAGVTPMTPDRKHMHHLALALGIPVQQTVFLLQFASFTLGMIAIAAWRLGVPDYWLTGSLLALLVVYHTAALRFWRSREQAAAGALAAAVVNETSSTAAQVTSIAAATIVPPAARAGEGDGATESLDS